MSILPDGNSGPDKWLIAKNIEAKKLLELPLLQKDIWRTIDDLGLEVNQHDKTLTINFEPIEPDWLKLLVKLYILIKSQQNYTAASCCKKVKHLVFFSRFIRTKSICTPEQINEEVFEEFDYYLRSFQSKRTHQTLAESTIRHRVSTLSNFFNLCRQEGWLNVNTYWFKNRRYILNPKNEEIEYIPEEIWKQLAENLHDLPEPIQRMIFIIRATGLRIGELLNLPLDCLRQRDKQWRLRFLTEKYKVEDELPICEELVLIIQEQQEYIRQQFGDKYNNLFGSNNRRINYIPAPRIMSSRTFNSWLNKLAIEKNICTKKGQVWRFKSHQFRKTVATVMSNAGVRDLIIQKYLRHRSPNMQNYYKHLMKKVIKDEYQQLMKETKYVDSTGKIVATHKPNNPITELMRRKMYQITTQYGECHRPILKSPCQTVNACWSCQHWLTSRDDLSYLKSDLQRVEAELEIAKKLDLVRQEKGLMTEEKKLLIRIQGLEKNS